VDVVRGVSFLEMCWRAAFQDKTKWMEWLHAAMLCIFLTSIWLSWKIKVQMSREALLSCLLLNVDGTISHMELSHSRAYKYPSLAMSSVD
jgi:hypothetical protein